ncbi:hypothetical protein [Streptomyces lichenis]|uniref:Uncharacterized protein n=1 Tax=Streptomyces lichenis TaxID=2306967 RepID=A0ABT0IJG7_9ACTN|nr:hypothetical protein [Streptomyces lichenis]MCK8681474.1 hypothetical protein [Streptomyces lichenis]
MVVTVEGCTTIDWNVSGTPGAVTLYTVLGDPDSGDTYALRRAPGE